MSYRDPFSVGPTAGKTRSGISLAQGAQSIPRSLPKLRDIAADDRPHARVQTLLRAPQAVAIDKPLAPSTGTISGPSSGPRPLPPTRRYDIFARLASGQVIRQQHIAPATALFEDAFAGFARATLVETDQGLCAVEDLVPGMMLATVDHGMRRLDWVGSMTALPATRPDAPSQRGMVRIMADHFGMGRPIVDVVAGPAARMLQLAGSQGAAHVGAATLIPCATLEDGHSVIRLHPPRPVPVYHLCLDRHATIRVAGIALESYHPGPDLQRRVGPAMLALFLSLFPHLTALRDFGPLAHPRSD